MDGYDRGYAWAVAFAAMAINFIMAGLGRMSGILYVAFIDIYHVDRRGASLPFSVRSSARNLLGPVVGILGQKYGVQRVIIAGGVVGTISSICCFFAPDILWITILFGGLGGIGAAFSTSLNQVVIGQYFRKYRTTAGGMGFSGGCIGSFLFPALMEYLIKNYGIDGTFLFIAAITMHTIPAAMIMKKPYWEKSSKRQVKSTEDDKSRHPVTSVQISEHKTNNETAQNDESATEIGLDTQFLRRNKDLVIRILMMEHRNCLNNESKMMDSDSRVAIESCIWEAMEDILCSCQFPLGQFNFSHNERLSKNNIFCDMLNREELKHFDDHKSKSFHLEKNSRAAGRGQWNKACSATDVSTVSDDVSKSYVSVKIRSLLRSRDSQVLAQCPDQSHDKVVKVMAELRKLHLLMSKADPDSGNRRTPSLDDATVQAHPEAGEKPSNSFWSHFKTALRLHANPLFALISMSRAMHLLTFVPVVTTVVDFTKDRGFPEDQGKFVIAALSLGDLLGRLCLGWVTDRGYMELPKFMTSIMVVQGVVTCTLPLMPNRESILVALSAFGMLQGSLFVRHPVLVNKYFGRHEQSIAMGCMNFFSGLMGLVLPLYIGYFRDNLGSYDYIFFINGTLGTGVGLLWALEPFFVNLISRKQRINQ